MKKVNPSNKTTSCHFLALPPAHCCAIVESIKDAVITFDLKKDVTYVNPATETITGVAVEEAIGRKCSELIRSELCQGQCLVNDLLRDRKPCTNLRTMTGFTNLILREELFLDSMALGPQAWEMRF